MEQERNRTVVYLPREKVLYPARPLKIKTCLNMAQPPAASRTAS
jgi:hypothetical protein